MIAPATLLRPIHITKAAIRETSLRGRSLVHRGSVGVNSRIIIGGTKSVVPRIMGILTSEEANRRRSFGVPARYPRYRDRLIHLSNRITLHYVGPGYPTRVERNLVRFMSHGTVGVSNLNRGIVDRLFTRGLVGSITSVCGLACRRLVRLREVNRGSMGGLVRTVRGSGNGSLRGLLFKLKVHRINTGTTGALTRRFNRVRTLRGTSQSGLATVGRVNRGVTSSVISFFSRRRTRRLVTRLGTTKIGVTCGKPGPISTRGSSDFFTKGAIILAKGLRVVDQGRTGRGVRTLNNGMSKDIDGGASIMVTKRRTKSGLAGTRRLKMRI